jgi:hypothetical protein
MHVTIRSAEIRISQQPKLLEVSPSRHNFQAVGVAFKRLGIELISHFTPRDLSRAKPTLRDGRRSAKPGCRHK